MNVDALFDKLATDLADAGAAELSDGKDSGERVLARDGRPFARLRGEHMSFLLPPGTPGLGDALALETSAPAGDGRWVEVPTDDVSEWERLARRAFEGVGG